MFLGSINNSHLTGRLLVLGSVVVVFLLGWELGDRPAKEGALSSQQLREALLSVEDQNVQLGKQVRMLALRDNANAQAIAELNQSLTSLRLQRSRERQELMLFRNLATGGDSTTGILIDSFSIEAKGANNFELEWMLVQPQARKRVNGQLIARIEGSNPDAEIDSWVEIDLQPVSAKDAGVVQATSADFEFRYFEEFTASVELPDGFEPLVVKIIANPVQPYRPAVKRITGEYPWRVASGVVDAFSEDLNQ